MLYLADIITFEISYKIVALFTENYPSEYMSRIFKTINSNNILTMIDQIGWSDTQIHLKHNSIQHSCIS